MLGFIKFLIRLFIVSIIVLYIFPDMPSVVSRSVGSSIGEFFAGLSEGFTTKVKEELTPQWVKELQTSENESKKP